MNVLDGTVIGHNMQRHRHQEFIRFLNAIEREAPAGKTVRAILDNYAAHTKSLEALLPVLYLPVLYLRGISAGDFQEALAALLGKDAPNLSAAVIARLKSEWEDEYRRWQKRDLSARHYVYVWRTASICRRAWSRRPNARWC